MSIDEQYYNRIVDYDRYHDRNWMSTTEIEQRLLEWMEDDTSDLIAFPLIVEENT